MKKVRAGLLMALLSFAGLPACFAQAPANDEFTNATVLSGNDIFFTGDLTGSTGHETEVGGEPLVLGIGSVQHSIWWAWTAPASGPVTLVALDYSEDTVSSEGGDGWPYIAVYTITNDSPYGQPPVAAIVLNAAFDKLSVTFTASAGTTYHLQFADSLFDSPTLRVNFRLIATNTPIILEQPADQTIAPGGSALFTVLAAGMNPLSYQWCTNGVPIPDATFPMLALDNVDMNQAGAYSVIVSNATGGVTSANVNLRVTWIFPNPSLALLGQTTNGFAFALAGESGRYWRIESSTDLLNWAPENSFPSTQLVLLSTNAPTTYSSVAFMTNSLISLVVPAQGMSKFVRGAAYAAPNEICNNNLKRIRFAKQLWARAYPYANTGLGTPVSRFQTPSDDELAVYGAIPEALTCPVGGAFTYNSHAAISTPTCSVSGHVLEEPR